MIIITHTHAEKKDLKISQQYYKMAAQSKISEVRFNDFYGLWARSDGYVSKDNIHWTKGELLLTGKHKKKIYRRLYYWNNIKDVLIHRVIADTFCENPNPSKFKVVDHIDGNGENNAVWNLRFVNTSLNNLASTSRNVRKKYGRFWGQIQCDGEMYYTKSFNNPTDAYMAAQDLKSKLFTELYKSYITNETETTRRCKYIRSSDCISPIALDYDNSSLRRPRYSN